MPVDVKTDIVIDRSVREVSAFAGDPSNAPRWYENIKSIEWQTPPPMRIGSKLLFSARFLGRTLNYVYEIVELVTGQRLVMRTAEGPFPMETTYEWEAIGDDKTRMTLRNRGEPRGFSSVAGLVMAPAMRRAMKKNLKDLKAILERR